MVGNHNAHFFRTKFYQIWKIYMQRSTKNIYETFAKSQIHTNRFSNICQWHIQRTTSTCKQPFRSLFQATSSFRSPPSYATLKHFSQMRKNYFFPTEYFVCSNNWKSIRMNLMKLQTSQKIANLTPKYK